MGRAIWMGAWVVAMCTLWGQAAAAREFTPQAGLWSIPSETNGQPGRGFSLDVQGNTAFLQIFNYTDKGEATFHTAVGQLDDAASMTVPLLRFKGGRSMGGAPQDAVADGTAGDVTVKFTDGLNGTVRFPGEAEQPIARLLVNRQTQPWWTQLSTNPPSGKEGLQEMHWVVNTRAGGHDLWEASLRMKEDAGLVLYLTSRSQWDVAFQDLTCQFESSTQVFDCVPLAGSRELLDVRRLRFRIVGGDVVGEIQPMGDATRRLMLNGWDEGSFSCNAEWCNGPDKRSARVHVNSNNLGGDCITGSCSGYDHVTLLPSSGAWIIDDEATGKPGRGVFLDVQDNTIIVQTSDYLADGSPAFHMGASTLRSSDTLYGETKASMDLLRYAGGRTFGGPARTAREVANAGEFQMAFALKTDLYGGGGDNIEITTGVLTLPGESTQSMRRLQLEPVSDGIEHMLGEYFIRWSAGVGVTRPGWVRLSRVEGRFAMNADGTVQCYQDLPRTQAYRMFCALLPTPNLQQNWLGSAEIRIGPFARTNASRYPSFFRRTRDAHGHWLGLGAVSLTGLAIPASP
ncbi:hypothetical protein H9K76_01980 [Diaphorobacter ruginosibacter]|uniref:Uncharacterized protein n=1 Tax=Diaphorobacter ruginosibacter TaxID=1715720 RepID=A0A7G9RQ12_9BURK|nr:hypothetical protein [Diaphorobacter ruginosibacter]QNN57687.1 hypothetical protein H9K76_01980 [Diaphorobacter ruginosibacter]